MNVHFVNFPGLRNDEHFDLFREYGEHVKLSVPAKLGIEPQFELFINEFAREDEAYRKITKSPLTDQIESILKVRDRNFRGIVDITRAKLNHYAPEVVNAATLLQIIFDSYGNIANKGRVEKNGSYENLLHELQKTQNTAAIRTVDIGEWIAELTRNHDQIDRLMQQRYDEVTGRTDIVMKEAREKVENAYHAINRRVLAHLEIEGDSENGELYSYFIRRLNVILERYSNVMAIRKARSSSDGDKK